MVPRSAWSLLLPAAVAAQVPVTPPRAPGAPAAVAAPLFDSAATIRYFDLGRSPLMLEHSARPGVFLSAVGRRAIAMGTEDGALELWSWPIKWLHDLTLAFRVPKFPAPIAGATVAQRVSVRPEGVTITYAHEQFTVREHVFVPLDLPAVIILLEVDAVRPLDVIAEFTPDIHFAWPAGLGGQYLIWEQNARAFLFSEGKRSINAFLGSPAVSEASDVPAHMLAADRPRLVLSVGGDSARYTAPRLGEPPGRTVDLRVRYIPIVLAGGEMPHDSALALYRRLMQPGAAEAEWHRVVAHADSIRRFGFSIRSPDTLLDRAVEYAKINLDQSLACNPDLGCGLVAGYGLSGGASDRPGFGWFFGGDAAINSFALDGIGGAGLVRDGALRFFARYQRADGKITHEISQGAGHVDWFDYPYPFYHGDTTPFWILAFGEYWRQTADTTLVRELWPHLVSAWRWSRSTDTDGDGLMDNPAAGAGALEVGDLQTGIQSDVYLSGVWIAALDRLARMARAVGEPAIGDSADALRERAERTLESRFWLSSRGAYGFALLQDGSVNPTLTAWPATAMAFGVLDSVRGAAMTRRLASSALMTDWGARPLGADSPLFDPLHYNNGAVWPFVTGWVSLADYNYHAPAAGWFALKAIARTGFDGSLGHNPEVLSGRLYKPLDTAVPQQFFATSMLLTPLIRGLLGLDIDAPARRVRIAPHLPPDWDSVAVDNVPVGAARLSFVVRRSATAISLSLRSTARTPLRIEFAPALFAGATTRGAAVIVTPGDVHADAVTTLVDSATVTIACHGGWALIPPEAAPRPGDRSAAPRILAERLAGGATHPAYEVDLEGRAGAVDTFRLRAATPAGVPIAVSTDRGAARIGAGRGIWRDLVIEFPRNDPDRDGYTMVRLTAEPRR